MWIVMVGNAYDGLRFYGPFASQEEAWDWEHDDDIYPSQFSEEQVEFRPIQLRDPK